MGDGLRTSARVVATAADAAREGANVVTGKLLPTVRQKLVPAARGAPCNILFRSPFSSASAQPLCKPRHNKPQTLWKRLFRKGRG